MDDFGLLVGRYLASAPTLADQELHTLVLDAAGKVIISGRHLSGTAQVAGDAGISVLAVRKDTDGALDDNGEYTALQVDANGRLKVATVVNVEPSDAEFLEDSAHTSGDAGVHVLAVRQDTLAVSTSADGDYASVKVDSLGSVYVADKTAQASLANIDASVNAIEASVAAIEADVDALTKTEDAAHVSGDKGVMPLAVRHDANTSLVSADGDYTPLQVDATGNLKTVAHVDATGTEAFDATDSLAPAGDGIVTITASGTPWITVASVAVGAGISGYVYGFSWSCDANADARLISDDGTDIIVYKRTLNSSAMPGYSEHFSEGGRIEIAGSATMNIKLQIKKRSATGANASGSGSLHVRLV